MPISRKTRAIRRNHVQRAAGRSHDSLAAFGGPYLVYGTRAGPTIDRRSLRAERTILQFA